MDNAAEREKIGFHQIDKNGLSPVDRSEWPNNQLQWEP